jgi:hypothetical protein
LEARKTAREENGIRAMKSVSKDLRRVLCTMADLESPDV